MRIGVWRPVLRLARRDALRARGRSALIVAMIALPVLALTAADVLARSAQLDPDEQVTRRLGSAQALLEGDWNGGAIQQAPDPREGSMSVGTASSRPRRADPTEHLPDGWRVLTSTSSTVVVRTEAGVAYAEWAEVAVSDPGLRARYEVRAGSAPRQAGDVAVSVALFERLGAEIGERLELTEPAGTYRLTGVLHQLGAHGSETVWALPGELIPSGRVEATSPQVYLVGNRPVTWTDVQALNRKGVLVTSRKVLLDPPADADVPYYAHTESFRSEDTVFLVLALTVVVALAGLEVCLLAGAAFAVGARRQARSLGLVAATGGRSTDVRRIVLAGGLVLGIVGAAVGVAAGLLLAFVSRPLLTELADADFGHFDVRPFELLAIAGLGVVTGLLSAVLPARTAARQDPVLALTGRRGQVRTPKKVPAIGVALTVVGIGAAALGSTLAVAMTSATGPGGAPSTTLLAGLIAGGAALAQIGLIITSPAIIGLAGRWSRQLPLAGRLALRDAARHRGRSAPAMAAVLTAVTGSMALLLVVSSLDDHDRRRYVPNWPSGSGGISLMEVHYDESTGAETREVHDAEAVLAALRPELPPFEPESVTTTVDASVLPQLAPGRECFLWGIVGRPTERQEQRAANDPRCQPDETPSYSSGGFGGGTPVGGPETVELMAGREPTADVERTLRAGGVVVFDRDLIDGSGHVRFEIQSLSGSPPSGDVADQVETIRLPAVYVEPRLPFSQVVLSAGAARTLGAETAETAVVLRFVQLPTEDEEEAALAALRNSGNQLWFGVERGYEGGYGLGLLALMLAAAVITLGAAGISTGLAQADARADHATLAAVGAAPRVRRTLAAAQALSVAGLGTALGVAAGFVPALALIGSIESLDVVVPWWHVLQMLVGIPLLAGASAWLLTRSRVPLERRVA